MCSVPPLSTTSSSSTPEEFQQLFIANQRRIFGYILTLLPRIDDAREVFQNTCVVLLKKADQFVHGTEFTHWACQIAYFEVCNFRRKRQRELLVLDNEVLDSLMSKQLSSTRDGGEHRQAALKQCLARLSPQDIQLIQARYSKNLTARQLAKELSRPEDSVYKALRRIRRRLQHCIECIERVLEHGAGSNDR